MRRLAKTGKQGKAKKRIIPDKIICYTNNMKMSAKYGAPGKKNETARTSMTDSKPVPPHFHLFDAIGPNLLIPDGTRIYEISDDIKEELQRLILKDEKLIIDQFLTKHDLQSLGKIDDHPPGELPLTAISLAIAQKCNLGCPYCYARKGD